MSLNLSFTSSVFKIKEELKLKLSHCVKNLNQERRLFGLPPSLPWARLAGCDVWLLTLRINTDLTSIHIHITSGVGVS